MLPPERLPVPPQWRDLLEELAPVFARRSEKSECVLREPEPVKFSFIGEVAEEQRQLPPGVRFPVVFMCVCWK